MTSTSMWNTDESKARVSAQGNATRWCSRVLRNAVLLALACGVLLSPRAAAQSAEQLRLSLGQSIVVDYPEDIRQVSTTDPGVADYTVVSTRQILVLAKGLGATDIVVWSQGGQEMFYNVTVGLNIEPLRRMLKETFPAENIDIRTAGDSISLNGLVSKQEIIDRSNLLAAVVAKNVVNNMRLPVAPVEKQILLRVRFAELDRQKASDLGINLNSVGALGGTLGGFGTGALATGQSSGTSGAGAVTRALTFIPGFNAQVFRPDLGLEALIRALQSQSILQILAEPNLVASNKKEASFLVGGEFPILVPQGGNSNSVTVQYREFGIRLKFTPEITLNDTIRLQLSQEVSTIDQTLAVAFNGYSVPGLTTRRAETMVELADGQSFIVAGLMDNQAKEQFQRIPFISEVPILGSLFKSKAEAKNSRELVMLVTPQFTTPLNASDPKPEIEFPLDYLKGAADDLRGVRKPTTNKK